MIAASNYLLISNFIQYLLFVSCLSSTVNMSNFMVKPTLFEWKSRDTLLDDPTWREYVNLVYGPQMNASALTVSELSMVYTLTSVAEFYHPNKWAYGLFPTFINAVPPRKNVYKDFEWAEVMRMSTKCFVRHNLKMHGQQLYEGVASPSSIDTSNSGTIFGHQNEKVPYGCWFFRLRGSGW